MVIGRRSGGRWSAVGGRWSEGHAFLIADATGCGKGREGVGVALNNMAKDAVEICFYFSTAQLFPDLKRDVRDLGCKLPVIDIRDTKTLPKKGIVFVPYSIATKKQKNAPTVLDRIVKAHKGTSEVGWARPGGAGAAADPINEHAGEFREAPSKRSVQCGAALGSLCVYLHALPQAILDGIDFACHTHAPLTPASSIRLLQLVACRFGPSRAGRGGSHHHAPPCAVQCRPALRRSNAHQLARTR